MTDTHSKGRFTTWLTYVKENPVHFIVSLILYIFPLLTIFAGTIEFFERYKIAFIIFLAILIVIHELQNIDEIEDDMKREIDYRDELSQKDREINNLRSEKDELKSIISAQAGIQASIPHILTAHIHKELGLADTERITLYEPYGGNFTSIGRYDTRPNYHNIHDKFSTKLGIAGKCYSGEASYYAIENLPSYDDDPKAYAKAINDQVDLNPNQIKPLSMKSRAQFAKLITTNDTSGVIVIESSEPQLSIDPPTLNDKLDATITEFIGQILRLNHDIEFASASHKKLKATLAYLYKHYPEENLDKLNKTNINQLVYLIDYSHQQDHHTTITQSPWKHQVHGAYTHAIDAAIKTHPDLKYTSSTSQHEKSKDTLDAKVAKDLINTHALSKEEKQTIDKVIKDHADQDITQLIDTVNNTPPMQMSKMFEEIDMAVGSEA